MKKFSNGYSIIHYLEGKPTIVGPLIRCLHCHLNSFSGQYEHRKHCIFSDYADE